MASWRSAIPATQNDSQNPTGYSKAIEDHETISGDASAAGTSGKAYILGTQSAGQADSSRDVYFLLLDSHGSTRALTDATTGTPVETYDYDALRVWLEVKYRLPDGGAALTRAVSQLTSIASVAPSEDGIALCTLRTPTLAERLAFLENLPPEVASRVQLIGGIEALSTWLFSFFH